MDVEPGAEGQNGTDTLDSNAEDNGEGTKYSNNSGRNSSSEQDDADTKDENNTKNNISGTKENAGNNAENSGASGDSVYNYNGKKKLTWPVMGNIILPYSMDATVYYTTLDQYACNDGIIVGAKVGEEVVSPANGRVVNIEDTDRYGKVVTILLGNYYKAYCGQLDNVDYEIGDDIQEGDVLGTVAEPTKSFVLEGPNVFFKMTYKDKTVNPVKYLRV
jgi:septal ring factor EnvC (AmiA/AmiB activator)